MPPERLLHSTTFKIERRRDLVEYDKLEKGGQYAIVSHRWTDNEITFQKYTKEKFLENHGEKLNSPEIIDSATEPGLAKIGWACSIAKKNGIPYIWIDACCIDKSTESFPELPQAINSMFQWYKEAAICYTFLLDVSEDKEEHQTEIKSTDPAVRRKKIGYFRDSEWFGRGWTLQELLAPERLEFFDHAWRSIGTKQSRSREVSGVTRIAEQFLREDIRDDNDTEINEQIEGGTYGRIKKACIATKMSWASARTTKIKDDMAYCLLGLFGERMETPYGENEQAFLRLQQLLVSKTQDESIFAWTLNGPTPLEYGLLAPWVTCFLHSANLTTRNHEHQQPRGVEGYRIVEEGVEFKLPEKWPNDGQGGSQWNNRNAAKRTSYDLGLNCWIKGVEGKGSVTIYLRKNNDGQWRRANLGVFKLDDKLKPSSMTKMGVTFSKTVPQYIPHKLSGTGEERLASWLTSGELGLEPTDPAASMGAVPDQPKPVKWGGWLGRLKGHRK